MKILFKEISESVYKTLDAPTLFEDKETARVFGVVATDKNQYKFSWQSASVKPQILSLNNSLCGIGIDLVFIILDTILGKVLLRINLDYFFMK